jgi:hypothetical protein
VFEEASTVSPIPRRIALSAISSVLLAAAVAAPLSSDAAGDAAANATERYYSSQSAPSPPELARERYNFADPAEGGIPPEPRAGVKLTVAVLAPDEYPPEGRRFFQQGV